MSNLTVLCIIGALFTKHFFCDFLLQVPYHYLNKGTYGHPGGISHALIHALGTSTALFLFVNDLQLLALLCLFDLLIHYHIDWAKMKINKIAGWTATTSEYFWWLLGLDQLLHALTYIFITWVIIK